MQIPWPWLALGVGGGLLLAALIAVALNGPGWPYFFALGLFSVASAFIGGLRRKP